MLVKPQSIFALTCCLLGLATAPAPPAAAQDDPLSAVVPEGTGVLLLEVTGEDAARLALADGSLETVPLPGGARVASLAALHEGWIVAGSFPAADGSRRLFVRSHEGSVPAPDRAGRAPIRRSPVLLVDGVSLAGMAWLEGDGERSLSVRASVWTGDGFDTPERVSGVGPGTQTALRGTVLADGSWLLVWTAFDGEDDEVMWSRRLGDSWLPAERLGSANAVPDIVPAVTASGTGALAAWSRYDGRDYRLVGARFDGTQWTELPWIGPPGSLYPTFHPGSEGPRLLYATVRPRGWSVMHLEDDGRELHRAVVSTGASARPVSTLEPTGRPQRPMRNHGETP